MKEWMSIRGNRIRMWREGLIVLGGEGERGMKVGVKKWVSLSMGNEWVR